MIIRQKNHKNKTQKLSIVGINDPSFVNDENIETDVWLQPSDIGAVLPLGMKTELHIDGDIIRVNSTDIIDPFIRGDYDDYEILSISVEKYGWLRFDLHKIG